MSKDVGEGRREVFDVRPVGIGEGIERQASSCAPEQRSDAGELAGEDRVPALKELGVGYVDTQRSAQPGEEFGVIDFAGLVPFIKFVACKSSEQMRGIV